MKVLVTGGAGFIGSHIVDHLIIDHYEVSVVDNLSTGKVENLNASAVFYQVDILDYKNLKKVFELEKPQYVIHHAAQTNVQQSIINPSFDAETNILGTINVLRCCVEFGTEKIVYASSAAIYGNPRYPGITEYHTVEPLSFYGVSKYTPEQYIKVFADLYQFDYTILRYANAYGTRQDPNGEAGVVSIFINKLLTRKQPVIFGDGTQTRDFIYVEDIALANLAALHLRGKHIINISTNQPTSLLELLEMMNKIYGSKMLPIYAMAKQGDIKASYLDNSKAQKLLSWEPQYTLFKGLTTTMEYYRDLYAT